MPTTATTNTVEIERAREAAQAQLAVADAISALIAAAAPGSIAHEVYLEAFAAADAAANELYRHVDSLTGGRS